RCRNVPAVQTCALPIFFGAGCGRLAPGQVSIGKARGNIAGRLRRTTKVDRRDNLRRVVQHRIVDLQVLAMVGDVLTAPQLADDVEKLRATLITLRLIQRVTICTLLTVFTAGDDVDEQTAFGVTLEGGGHLRGQGRGDQSGTQSNQELQTLRGV